MVLQDPKVVQDFIFEGWEKSGRVDDLTGEDQLRYQTWKLQQDRRKIRAGTPEAFRKSRGGARTAGSFATYVVDIQDTRFIARLSKNTAELADTGTIADDKERAWFEEIMDYRSRKRTVPAMAEGILLDMVPFVQDLLIGGKVLQKAGLRVLTREAVDKAFETWMSRRFITSMAKQGLTGAAQIATAEAIKEGLGAAGLPVGSRTRVAFHEDIYRQRYKIERDDADELRAVLMTSNPSVASALYRAGMQTLIEGASERIGGHLMQIGPMQRVSAVQHAILDRFLGKGGTVKEFTKLAATNLAWDGWIEEFLEERAADVLGVVFGTQKLADVMPEWDQYAAELLAFSVPGAAGALARGPVKTPIEEALGAERVTEEEVPIPELEEEEEKKPALEGIAPSVEEKIAVPTEEVVTEPVSAPEVAPVEGEEVAAPEPSEGVKVPEIAAEAAEFAPSIEPATLERLAQAEGREVAAYEEVEAVTPEQQLATRRGEEAGIRVRFIKGMRAPGASVTVGEVLISAETPEPARTLFYHEAVHDISRRLGGEAADGGVFELYRRIRAADSEGLRRSRQRYREQWVQARVQEAGVDETQARADYRRAYPRAAMREEGLATYAQDLAGYLELLTTEEGTRHLERIAQSDPGLWQQIKEWISAVFKRLTGRDPGARIKEIAATLGVGLTAPNREAAVGAMMIREALEGKTAPAVLPEEPVRFAAGGQAPTVQQQGFSTFAARFAPPQYDPLDEPAADYTLTEVTEGVQMPEFKGFKDFRTKFQDLGLPIQEWERLIKAAGGNVELSVRDVMANVPGRAQERFDQIDRFKKSFENLMREQKFWDMSEDEAMQMLGDTASALDAQDRNPFLLETKDVENGSGMSDEEARQILDENLARPGVQKAMDMARELNDATRAQMLSAGVISGETNDFWAETFPNYFPQRTAETDPEGPAWTQIGPARRGFQVSATVVHSMEGRRTRADNPIIFSLVQAAAFNIAAEKARVGARMWYMLNHPDNIGLVSWNELEQPENPKDYDVKDAFGIWVDGERKIIRISSPDVNRSMKALGFTPVPRLLRAHGALVRVMSRLVTSWYPDFFGPNFFKDLDTAMINITPDAKPWIRTKILASIPGAMRAIAADEFLGRPAETKMGKFYEEVFKPGGGKIGWARQDPFERVEKDFLSQMKRGIPLRTLIGAVKQLEHTATVIEMAVRVSVAHRLEEAGVPREKAIRAAREITVDFNRRGEKTAWMAATWIFINARIQGASQMIINAHRDPKMLLIGAGITTAAFGHHIMLYLAMGDDEDDEPRLWKKSEWERDRNILIPNVFSDDPDATFKKPMAYGYNVYWVMGDRMAEAMLRIFEKGEDADVVISKLAERVAAAAWDGFSPLSSGTWEQALAPTGLVPFVQIGQNVNWHGGPVMPEGNPFDPAPPPDSERAWKSVSPLAQETARFLNRMFGGNRYRAGSFLGKDMSVSPESLEHIYDSYLGGLAKIMEQSYKLSTKPWSETGWNQVPVMRRFYSDDSSFADSGNFYTNVEEVHRASREVEKMRAKAPAKARRIAPLLDQAKAHVKRAKTIRDRRDESKDSKERERYEEMLRKLYMSFNKQFNARQRRDMQKQ